jgi:hypothetical protein
MCASNLCRHSGHHIQDCGLTVHDSSVNALPLLMLALPAWLQMQPQCIMALRTTWRSRHKRLYYLPAVCVSCRRDVYCHAEEESYGYQKHSEITNRVSIADYESRVDPPTVETHTKCYGQEAVVFGTVTGYL